MKAIVGGVLICMGVLAASSQAQSIYKCVVGSAITYQQTPCEVPAPAKGVSSNTALIGQWRYDHDTTMAWMKRHATMTKEQAAALDGLAGHVTYNIMKDHASLEVTDFDVTVDGRALHRKGYRQTILYTVMSASPQIVSVSAQNEDNLNVYTTDFHFDGHDAMWISAANQRLTAVDNANARVFFARVR